MSTQEATFAAIRQHLGVIIDKASTPAALAAAVKELDAVVAGEFDQLPGDLRHFLSRRSYHKAVLWLDGTGPIPRGICGRGE